MESVVVRARAKINLVLDVLGVRPDGYHELRSIMQTLKLHDTLLLRKTSKYPLKLVCNDSKLPTDEHNLVNKAARHLQNVYGIEQGVLISLRKRIPVAAGLAGGSADCAATLLGMNALFDLHIPLEQLTAIGATFGADVPFCLMGGTALAEGIGERLTRLPPHPIAYVLLARPPVAISTRRIFQQFDVEASATPYDFTAVTDLLARGDLPGIAACFKNALFPITAQMHPEIVSLIAHMRRLGALNASMSGSGPTVFGYFDAWREAETALRGIQDAFPHMKEICLTEVYNP